MPACVIAKHCEPSNEICIMFNKKAGVLVFLAIAFTHSFAQDAILHRQDLRRDDVTIGHGLKGTKGTLTLCKDSIHFSAADRNNEVIDFAVSYAQITKIKRYRGILLPNRIGIKTSDNTTFRLFTYKRKEILAILEERTESLKGE